MRLLFRVSLCLLFLGLAASATPLFAQLDLYWTGTNSTDFNDPTNWVGSDFSTPPPGSTFGTGDWLHITNNIGTGYTATIGGNLLFDPLRLTSGTDTWINNIVIGSDGDTTNTCRLNMIAGNLTINSEFSIGNSTGSTNFSVAYDPLTNTVNPDSSLVNMFVMSGGTIQKNATGWNFNIGTNGGNGMVVMSNAATINNSDATYVGVTGGSKGWLALQDNAYLNNTNYIWTDVGDNTGSGTLTMAGSARLNTGEAFFGNATGQATIIMTGGTMTAGNNGDWYGIEGSLDLGRWGGTGTMQVSGSSVLNVKGRTMIGNETNGAGGAASYGELDLSGNAIMNTSSGLMRNYGWVWGDGGDVYVGCNEWENNANALGTVTLGGGYGVLTLHDSAQLNTPTGQIRIGVEGGHGTITMADYSQVSTNSFIVGDNSNVSSTASATVAPGQGYCSMSGTSHLNASGNLQVGTNGGDGTMSMSGTSSATVGGQFYVGAYGSSQGVLNMDGYSSISIPSTSWFAVGAGGDTPTRDSGTINMHGHSSITTSGGWTWFGMWGGSGTLNMDGNSTFNVSSTTFRIGSSENGGTTENLPYPEGYVNMSGSATMNVTNTDMHIGIWGGAVGYFSMTDHATLNLPGSWLAIGDFGGTQAGSTRGYMTMTGSSQAIIAGDVYVGNGAATGIGPQPVSCLTIGSGADSPYFTNGGWLSVGANGGGAGSVSFNSGTVLPGLLFIGRQGSTGTWTQTGGLLSTGNLIYLGEDDWNGYNCNAVFNLNGGEVRAPGFLTYTAGGTGGVETLNLNGGTLTAIADNAAYINPNGNAGFTATLGGNVTVNTSLYNIGFGVGLSNGAGSGTLNKLGLGNLTLSGNNSMTGVINVQSGRLIVTGATAFSGAATINVPNGSTLGLGSVGSQATSATVNFGGAGASVAPFYAPTTPILSVGVSSGSLSSLAVGTMNFNAPGGVLPVDLQTSGAKFDASGTTTGPYYVNFGGGTTSSTTVLTYANSTNVPTVLPRYDSIGLSDITVTTVPGPGTSGSIVVTLTNGLRSFQGPFGSPDNNWSTNWDGWTNWGDPDGSDYDPPPNGPNDKAWFVQGAPGSASNDCILDQNATVCSLLFYVSGGGWSGYTIEQGPAGTEQLTLSAIGGTTAAEAQIQSLSGTNTVVPGIILGTAGPGTVSHPRIFIEEDSVLNLNGPISETGGGSAALNIVGGSVTSGADAQAVLNMPSSASSYTGPMSIDNAIVNTGYLTPGAISMHNAALDYTGGGVATVSGGLLVTGSALLGCQAPGATMAIPMNANTQFLVSTMTVGQAGDQGTVKFDWATSSTLVSSMLWVEAGTALFSSTTTPGLAPVISAGNMDVQGNATATFTSTVPTTYTIASQLGAGWQGGTGTIQVLGASTTLNVGAYLLIGRDVATANGTFIAGTPGGSDGPTINIGGWVDVGQTGYGQMQLNANTKFTSGDTFTVDVNGLGGLLNMRDTASLTCPQFQIDGPIANPLAGVATIGRLHSSDSPVVTIANWINIGFWGTQGTLNLYGNSKFTVNGLGGWGGIGAGAGIGNLNMDDNAQMNIAASTYWATFIGADQWSSGGGTANINMTGNSQLVSPVGWLCAHAWNGITGDQNRASINLSGNALLNVGFFSLATGQGSQGTLTMSGASTLTSPGGNVTIGDNINGWGGTGYLSMIGTSHIQAGGQFSIGDSGCGTATMSGSASVVTSSWFSVGRGNGTATGSFTMNDYSSLTVGAWSNIGCWGGAVGIMTMHNHASATLAGEMDVGCYGNSTSGTLSLNDSSKMAIGGPLSVGSYDNNLSSQVVLNGNSTVTVAGTTEIDGKLTPAAACLTLNNNSVMNAQQVWVAQWYNNGDVSGAGSLVLNSAASLTCTRLHIGDEGGSGLVTVNGNAQLTVNGDTELGYEWGSTPALVGSSTMTVAGSGSLVTVTGSLSVGCNGGVGVYNQNAGRTTVPNQLVILGETDYWDMNSGSYDLVPATGGQSTGRGTLNLNAGVFDTTGITTNAATYGDAVGNTHGLVRGTINFNGATLQALANNANFIAVDTAALSADDGVTPLATMTLNVQNGGAVIDSNGYNIGIGLPMVAAGTGGLTKLGTGTLCLSANNTYTGNTTISNGTLLLGNGTIAGSVAGSVLGNISIANGATLGIDHSNAVTIANNISGSGSVTKLAAGTATLTGTNTYTGRTTTQGGTLQLNGPGARNPILTGGGTDIQNGRTIEVFDYSGVGDTDPASGPGGIQALLTASYDTGKWDTGKFQSSTAVAAGTTLGWKDTGTQVIVMDTLPGDITLDGSVNALDLNILLAHYNTTGDTWATGDLNYDGKTNSLDLNILLARYNTSLPAGSDVIGAGSLDPSEIRMLSGAGFTVTTPEPGTFALLAAALVGLLAYAWRKRK